MSAILENNLNYGCIRLNNTLIYGYKDDYIFKEINDTHDFFESFLLNRWKQHFENSNFILDIGANIGNHTLFMATQANCKNIISFEPIPKIYNILSKNVSENHLNNIKLVNCAVGETEGYAQISNEIENNSGATSLKKVENETEIKVISIDNYLLNNKSNIDFIKIDVEGFEVNVLRGMINTLSTYKPKIWIEISKETFKEVNNILSNLGYTILDYDETRDFNVLYCYSDENFINFEEVFQKMLDYCKQSKDLYWENRKNESRFLYEQKKCENLIEQSKKQTSTISYEQKKFKNLKNEYEYLKAETNNLREEHAKLNKYYDKQVNSLKKEVNAYKSRKIVRFANKLWKFYYKPKSFSKKWSYIAITAVYEKLKPFPKITTLIHKTNNKFNLLNKEAALKTYETRNGNINKKPAHKPKKIKDIKVAVIFDEFTYNSFKYEFDAIVVEPSNWLRIFEMEKPDLFFCESAWRGVDTEKKTWQGKIYSSTNFKNENRKTLLSIIEYCKKHNIPTIFWNKEDPTHYDDKIHNFVDTALKFDHIFTTAEECVQKYKEDYGHESVHCLPFAGQPKLFNPIEKYNRTNDIVFAGSWYNNHPQRCIEMEKIFDNILDSGYNLKIYNRHYETKDPNHFFPDKYKKLTNPSVPFNQIEKVYKESQYSLNINTETKSKTMFARRVFELMLCNTLVLSNYSEGVYELFGDNVIFVGKEKLNIVNPDKKRMSNLHNVLENHTYSKRFKQILDAINYDYLPEDTGITLYYTVNSESEIEDILKHYNSINYKNKKLTLLLSQNIPNHLIKNIYQQHANNEVSIYSLYYLLNQNGVIQNNTQYFIFADLQLKPNFIEKASLHYSYIEESVGVALGDNEFTFETFTYIKNVILHRKRFMEAFNSIFKDISIEIPVYTLKEYRPKIKKIDNITSLKAKLKA